MLLVTLRYNELCSNNLACSKSFWTVMERATGQISVDSETGLAGQDGPSCRLPARRYSGHATLAKSELLSTKVSS